MQRKIPEIPGGEANGTEISAIKFRNFGYTSRGCPNVPESRNIWKTRRLLYHSKTFRFPVPLCHKFLEISVRK